MHIGERIKKIREEKGVTQAELAERADIGQPYISKLEKQIIRAPSRAVIERIANALEQDLMDLAEGTTYDLREIEDNSVGFCPNMECPAGAFNEKTQIWEPYKTPIQDEDREPINFCIHCGKKLVAECQNCGRRIKRPYRFCPGCGELLFRPLGNPDHDPDDIPF